ncbi:MAG TPA: ExbD/TolR family protein [Thermoanaerobaculia bacterium]|jgi:biopolymer transport protein ExbD|nr:ExbD/TolR family protein [Thermoanaerobaculia bacterium]
MSPQSKLSSGAIRSDINVTPLVDVCLVLLIIFMVVTPMIQAGVKVDLPKTAKASSMPGEQNDLNVTIQQDGSLWVRGTRTADADLHNVLAAIHQAEPDRDVIVRGDRRLQYEKVSEVLTTLGDVGFARIGLVTERKPAG